MNGMIQTRVTRQRTVILEELRKLTCHPTADELCDIVRRRLPHISLGTVYRNLDHLAEEGIVLRLDMAGKSKRYDGNIQPHQHVCCIYCGRVADVYPPNGQKASIEGVEAPGFSRIVDARIVSGHAGLFSNAEDLARLAQTMPGNIKLRSNLADSHSDM